jgi:hypothetical protein
MTWPRSSTIWRPISGSQADKILSLRYIVVEYNSITSNGNQSDRKGVACDNQGQWSDSIMRSELPTTSVVLLFEFIAL